jgi:hypothetical protein
MTRILTALVLTLAPVGPVAAQGNDGTDLILKPITVQGQHQLHGRYGDKWSTTEVRARAAQTCAGAGMRLVHFEERAPDPQGRKTFAAVCK